jgi:hypothetical protein
MVLAVVVTVVIVIFIMIVHSGNTCDRP